MKIAREVGRPLVGTADVHYLGREDFDNHQALLCVQTKSTLAGAEDVLRHQRVLLEELGGDGAGVRALARGAAHLDGDRRALSIELELGKMLIPRFPTPNGEEEGAYLRRAGRGGPAPPLRRPGAGRGARAAGHGARGDRADGLRRLLPDRLGLRQVRQGQRHRRGPGPRLGGGLDRLLRAVDHRRRPAGLRPAVRALPERRARVHAGHRHRLLGEGPRPRDPLRGRQVRPGVGGPDHHLRPHVPPRRHPRRRARARATTTRPATASPSSSPSRSWAARRASTTTSSRSRSCARSTTPSPRRARSSRPPRASRGSSATRRSTRPRW